MLPATELAARKAFLLNNKLNSRLKKDAQNRETALYRCGGIGEVRAQGRLPWRVTVIAAGCRVARARDRIGIQAGAGGGYRFWFFAAAFDDQDPSALQEKPTAHPGPLGPE
jgi:hypothetical protein